MLPYAEWGDPEGCPVVVLHGTPGSRLGRFSDNAALAATGIWQIGINRPGYGEAVRVPNRRVVDVVPDVLAVADALGIERFAVTGASGGGPFALAMAALAPSRVVRCRVTASLAPCGIPGFFDGMDSHNIEEWDLVAVGNGLPEVTRRVELMRSRVLDDPGSVFADLDLSRADRKAMADQRAFAVRRESLLEAFTTPFGWYDDDVAFVTDWGFDPATIRVPVEIRYGVHDVFVPRTHGDWLAEAIPGAEVTVWEDLGHFGDGDAILDDYRRLVTACR